MVSHHEGDIVGRRIVAVDVFWMSENDSLPSLWGQRVAAHQNAAAVFWSTPNRHSAMVFPTVRGSEQKIWPNPGRSAYTLIY